MYTFGKGFELLSITNFTSISKEREENLLKHIFSWHEKKLQFLLEGKFDAMKLCYYK